MLLPWGHCGDVLKSGILTVIMNPQFTAELGQSFSEYEVQDNGRVPIPLRSFAVETHVLRQTSTLYLP